MSDLEYRDEVTIKILDTAQALFQECGIEDVTMHQVAQSAGIGQGTLYRRFPNKNMLCLTLMQNKFQAFMLEIEQYLQNAKHIPAVQKLTTIMTRLVMLAGEDLEGMKQIIRTERLRDARENCFELPIFLFVRDRVQELLEEATEAGALRPVDLFFTAGFITTSLRPEMIAYLKDEGYEMTEIAARYCETFILPLFME